MLSVCSQLSRQQNLDSLLIPESIGQEMRRVLQGMLKYDVKERSSANDTMMLFKSTGKYLPVLVQFSSKFSFNSLSLCCSMLLQVLVQLSKSVLVQFSSMFSFNSLSRLLKADLANVNYFQF